MTSSVIASKAPPSLRGFSRGNLNDWVGGLPRFARNDKRDNLNNEEERLHQKL